MMLRHKTIINSTLMLGAVLLFILQAKAQYFNKRIDFMGLEMPDTGYSIEIMEDGSFLLFGQIELVDIETLNQTYVLGRTIIAPDGEVILEHLNTDETGSLFPGTANTSHRLISGGYVSSGTLRFYPQQSIRLITLNRYHDDGTLQWIKYFGDSINYSFGHAATEQVNKNLACVGSVIYSLNWDDNDAFLLIADSLGSMLEFKTFGGNDVDEFRNICPTLDGGYILGGYTRSYNSQENIDHFVVKTDSSGNQQWSKVIGTPREDTWADVLQTSDSNYVICGSWNEYSIGSTQHFSYPYISKLDSDGEPLWEHIYDDLSEGPHHGMKFRTIKELENGDLIAVGTRLTPGIGIMLRTDEDGNVLWYREFIHPTAQSNGASNSLNDVIPDGEGGFVAAGSVYIDFLDFVPDQDLWVFRTDSMGCLVPGCHLVDNVAVHEEEVLVSMYPNPVNDLLSVHLKSGPMPRGAQLELFDMHGRQHSTTAINPGATTYILPMGHLPAGMYVLRCVTGGEVVWSGKVMKE